MLEILQGGKEAIDHFVVQSSISIHLVCACYEPLLTLSDHSAGIAGDRAEAPHKWNATLGRGPTLVLTEFRWPRKALNTLATRKMIALLPF